MPNPIAMLMAMLIGIPMRAWLPIASIMPCASSLPYASSLPIDVNMAIVIANIIAVALAVGLVKAVARAIAMAMPIELATAIGIERLHVDHHRLVQHGHMIELPGPDAERLEWRHAPFPLRRAGARVRIRSAARRAARRAARCAIAQLRFVARLADAPCAPPPDPGDEDDSQPRQYPTKLEYPAEVGHAGQRLHGRHAHGLVDIHGDQA